MSFWETLKKIIVRGAMVIVDDFEGGLIVFLAGLVVGVLIGGWLH